MPVFVSVTVIFTLAAGAPDESVTVPSKVAFTACPLTGAENAKSIAPRLIMQAKKERESFSITHPTCFEEVRKEPKTGGTGSTP